MKQPIRLNENRLRQIIRETINEVAMNDFDDDGSWLDMPNQNHEQYRVRFDIKERDEYGSGWQNLDSGVEEFNSQEEAFQFVEHLQTQFRGCFVNYLEVEKKKDTSIGDKWERIWQAPRDFIR